MSNGGRTIILVDDHAVVREGYRAVLHKQPGLRVVAEAADGADAYRLFKQARPDLVIMDLTLPGISGIETIRRIRAWDPSKPFAPAPEATSPRRVRRTPWCGPSTTCSTDGLRSARTWIANSR